MQLPLNLTFWVTESGSGMQSPKTMGTAIQADLAAVGVNTQIQSFEWGAYLNKYGAGLGMDADMAELSWMFDSGDPAHMLPNNLYGPSCAPKGFNGGCYQNSQVDQLMDDAVKITDRDQRGAMYRQIQGIVADTAPWIFVDNQIQNAAMSSRVSGLQLAPVVLHDVPQPDRGNIKRECIATSLSVSSGSYLSCWASRSSSSFVTRLTPGDPARVLLGPRATDAEVARLRASYGLDAPVYFQYLTWLGHLVRGDLGESIQLHRPVGSEIHRTVSRDARSWQPPGCWWHSRLALRSGCSPRCERTACSIGH